MERYFVFGVMAAVAVVSLIILIFGVGKNNSLSANLNQNYYNTANSSLRQSIFNDILGFQLYQDSMPLGKVFTYSVHYSLSTSTKLSNGSASNSSESSAGDNKRHKKRKWEFRITVQFYSIRKWFGCKFVLL
jgi:hypothetical protein